MKLTASFAPRCRGRALVLLTGALLAVTAAACKDEKVRAPFAAVPPPTAAITTATPIQFVIRGKPGEVVVVSFDVSADGGRTFVPATPTTGSPPQVVITAEAAGALGTFMWDPLADLGPGIHREVVLRASPRGREKGVAGDTGPFTVDLTDRLDPVASGGDDLTRPVAAPLPDGRVWVAGGELGGAPRSRGFIYDPRTNALTSTDGLRTSRATPGWALLRGGQVLVAGGDVGGAPSDAAETFALDASGDGHSTEVPGGLLTARDEPAVAALPDGRAVVIGGAGAGGPVAQVEVFTPGPGGGSFALAFTDPATARVGATATALPDGRVLVTGGVDDNGVPQTTALLIDANATGATPTDDDVGRAQHAAVLLPDGRVLVAGGTTALDDPTRATTSASIYDPVTERFSSAGNMDRRRHRPGIAYAGGFVVVFGGAGESESATTAERFDIEARTWDDIAGPSFTDRADAVAVATGPGRALVAGGGAPPEVYTPDASLTTQAFDPLITTIPAARADHTSTLVGDTVLVVGGTDGVTVGLSSVEAYSTRTRRFEARAPLAHGRSEHAAVLTGAGLLVVGGRDETGLVAEAELYDALADRWQPAGALATPRAGATAVVLADGTVLVSGGVDDAGDPLASQERWSPFTRTFTSASALPEARAEHRALTFGAAAVIGPGLGATGPTDAVDVLTLPALGPQTATGEARGRAGLSLTGAAPGVVLVSGGDDATGPRADAALLDLRQLSSAGPVLLPGARPLEHARSDHEAVALRSGTQVLLSGGRGPNGGVRDEGELFRFSGSAIDAGRGERTNDRRATKARVRHTATLLLTGRVLIVGGVDERGVAIAGAELFLP